ncbi:MAG TPA: DUF3276 family protein [Flavobacterium sp.]|nr:DUF3276 family protein [Flavobacterium sp.]
MEGLEKAEDFARNDREEIFSKAVRAGKRTYFFDVKATRKNDYYLTITESKKKFEENGRFFFEKHKVFLYKEDFDKFSEGLLEAIDYIKTNLIDEEELKESDVNSKIPEEFVNIKFEDLNE